MSDRERVFSYVSEYLKRNSFLKLTDEEINEIIENLGTDYSGILEGKYDLSISGLVSRVGLGVSDEDDVRQEDMDSILGIFGTGNDRQVGGNGDFSYSEDPHSVLSVFERSRMTGNNVRNADEISSDKIDVQEQSIHDSHTRNIEGVFSSLIRESARFQEKKDEVVDKKPDSGKDSSFTDHDYDEIFAIFNRPKDSGDTINDGVKGYHQIKRDEDEVDKVREANKKAIADFANKFNDATRRKMYGDDYQSFRRRPSDEDVDSIIKEYYSNDSGSKSGFINLEYGNISEQDNRLKDYIRWFLTVRELHMFESKIDTNKFAIYIFDKLKNEERGLYHSLMKSLINTNFDYSKVYDRSFISFILDKIDLEFFHEVTLNENYFEVSNYCFRYLRKNKKYLELSHEKSAVDDILFKSSYNLADYLVSRGYTISDIEDGKCSKVIESWITGDILYWKSVKRGSQVGLNKDDSEEEIGTKLTVDNFFKRYVNKKVVLLGLTATLLLSNLPVIGDILAAPYNFMTDTIPTFVQSVIDKKDENIGLEDFDDYGYRNIKDSEDKNFAETYSHLINIFPEYMEYDLYLTDNYEQLCLYEAYKSMDSEDFNLMDSIVNIMCSFYQQSGRNDVLPKIYNKAALDENSSVTYPVYVYRMLDDAGFDVSQYTEAVVSYTLNSGSSEAFSKLSREHKKTIREMFSQYDDYCEQLEEEFVSLPEVQRVISNRGDGRYGRS